MIRHIVLWTLHNPADAPRFKADLDSCRGLVDGMGAFEVAGVAALRKSRHSLDYQLQETTP